jgi:hypothetical protein
LHFDQLRPWVSLFCNPIDVAEPPWPLTSPPSPRKSNFTGETLGRNQGRSFVQAQQPKTKPDDAFRIVGRCEHCGTMKTIDEAQMQQHKNSASCTEEKAD